jgi:N-acetylneuraminate synthase
MSKYTNIGKIPSALITDLELCKHARNKFENLIVSTGMSTETEVIDCLNVCNPDVIMHTNSTYPCKEEELNLRYIEWLTKHNPGKEIGYSGHELKLCTTLCTIPMGVTWIERHVTKDGTLWGSDQSSSIEPKELKTLIDDIKTVEKAIQYKPGPRMCFESENEKRLSLRK